MGTLARMIIPLLNMSLLKPTFNLGQNSDNGFLRRAKEVCIEAIFYLVAPKTYVALPPAGLTGVHYQ